VDFHGAPPGSWECQRFLSLCSSAFTGRAAAYQAPRPGVFAPPPGADCALPEGRPTGAARPYRPEKRRGARHTGELGVKFPLKHYGEHATVFRKISPPYFGRGCKLCGPRSRIGSISERPGRTFELSWWGLSECFGGAPSAAATDRPTDRLTD
jgi:hypothetical protein